jgi:hypothetical protein
MYCIYAYAYIHPHLVIKNILQFTSSLRLNPPFEAFEANRFRIDI